MGIDPQVKAERDLLAQVAATVYEYVCSAPGTPWNIDGAAFCALNVAEALVKEATKRAVAAVQEQRTQSR